MERDDSEMNIDLFVKEFMKNNETTNLIKGINKNAGNKVDELEIIVKNKDRQEAILEASNKAYLVCNFLSYKCKDSISPTYSGSTAYHNNVPCGTEATKFFTISNSTKIKISNEINTIDTNPQNHDYSYYCRGLTAEKNLDFAGAIRDYYQIIENNEQELQHLVKYRSLRDLLSHTQISRPNTIRKIKSEFPQIKTNANRFDFSSIDNLRFLRLTCNHLKEEIFQFLKSKDTV
jgi:hypothetical protein